MTALAAIAASTALPPRWRICVPACDASGWLVATMPSVVATFERPATTCGRGGSCPIAAIERIETATRDSSTVRVFMASAGPPSGGPTITQYTLSDALDTAAPTGGGSNCGCHMRPDRDGGIGAIWTRRFLRLRR